MFQLSFHSYGKPNDKPAVSDLFSSPIDGPMVMATCLGLHQSFQIRRWEKRHLWITFLGKKPWVVRSV